MNRRTSAGTKLLAGMLLAVSLTLCPQAAASAAAPRPAPPAGTPTTSLAVNETAIEYVMRSDGVSRAEAVRRLAAQPAQLSTAERLTSVLGPARTAGAWLDRRTGELVVDVLDARAAATVRAAKVRPRQVQHSTAELAGVVDRLSATAGAAAGSVGVHAESNTVVVTLAQDAPAQSRRAVRNVARSFGSAVRIQQDGGAMIAAQSVHPGFTETRTGSERCTAGFTARDPLLLNSEVMITSAHCVMNPFGPLTTVNNNQFLGQAYKTRPDRDVAAVLRLSTSTQQLGPHVWAFFSGFKTVVEAVTVIPHAVVCKSGSFTGFTCGRVLGVNQNGRTIINGLNQPVTGLTATDLCIKGGDSGGPVIIDAATAGTAAAAGTTQSSRVYDKFGNLWTTPAQGMQFCGNEFSPPRQTLSAYVPIEQTLADLGLTIMTG